MLDTIVLSRIQFATNISFHILFPTITIALCWFLLFFKIRYDQTGDPVWMRAYRFWVKIFALTFALGVVSGITMSFQFGTNWPGFMERVGNIAGPLLGYEVLTAFFLEATFLGIMLFGIKRVPPKIHTLATAIVALGTTLSAFWILSLNSWMQTPTGFELRDGVVYPTDWLAIIFNPSFPYRFSHMLLASALTASFLVAGLSAYRILRGDVKRAPRLTLKVSLTAAMILAPMQALVGDFHGLNTLEHQPQKIAAMEGVWHTEKGAPLLLFAIPDEQEKRNHFEIAIPKMASFILTHDLEGEIKGLNEFEGQHPPVKPVFFAFRVMVGLGVLMIAVAWCARIQLARKPMLPRWLLKTLVAMSFSGWLATLAGWYVTEIGRQPYLVSGVLTTAEAATDIAPANVGISLAMYLIVYAFLLVAYLHTIFVMARRAIEIEEISDEEHGKLSPNNKEPSHA
ncbi:cytochrome ubiquinol oxidase subunit I [Dasania sp. GY-MA-18]|uniref:Cytochrome ubiquinol oxidase subunit I n=1 Tax=Dasania phycosphaerae TaxID=2950436 RepID=A0A9J6RPJ6_9GAMM|nr:MULTISPECIES: cytochrome ubiquinol oxidase subunit I [Dasania]MCR8923515.1 cytochrome ubiquinol oxidase subunit I [Dasania sp. GY-MA-18]MCZ0865949.1 cytochrome ubiquinol oxidase subunit I [Dasania phycosphaerae]MCZ0869673.1 cytochrome ubiquinol oxidase subunit I [Dasania phycosphaerae]